MNELKRDRKTPRQIGFIVFMALAIFGAVLTVYLGTYDAYFNSRKKFLETGESLYWAVSWFSVVGLGAISTVFAAIAFLLAARRHRLRVLVSCAAIGASAIFSGVSWTTIYNHTPDCQSAAANVSCDDLANH